MNAIWLFLYLGSLIQMLTLYRLDLTNGNVLGTTNIGPARTGVYNGLALADPLQAEVPEPVGLFPIALAAMIFARRRRQRR